MRGEVGDAGSQRQADPHLFLIVGDKLGTEGMGGDDGVWPAFPQQFPQLILEEVLQRGPCPEQRVVCGLVVEIIKPTTPGDQKRKALVNGL